MNKHLTTALCFLIGTACIGGAVYFSQVPLFFSQQNESYVSEPETISEMKMFNYVSLPVVEGMKITEEKNESDRDEIKQQALESLIQNAKRLEKVEDRSTVLTDCTVIQDGKYIDRKKDYLIYLDNSCPEEIRKSLLGAEKGTNISIDKLAAFDTYTDVSLTLSIKDILDMPYPITDEYMKKHTEYTSYQDMIDSIAKDNESNVRSDNRKDTLENLLNTAIEKTTFMELPDTLLNKELECLKKEDLDVQYDDARTSLKKILFIKSMIENYNLASAQDIEDRLENYIQENGYEQLTDYERQRLMYLLYEEDVTNFIYKNIEIIPSES